jgi:thermostable 8-oxoguanine DNA glycosylase
MIIPSQITQLNRTRQQREEFLIFCVLCAGKSSEQQAVKLNGFLSGTDEPFTYISGLIEHEFLVSQLEHHKLGKYDLISNSMSMMTQHVDCVDWDRDSLVDIPGISYKTASLYRMHTFGDRIACLDTHVLRYLRNDLGVDAPKVSPSNKKKYETLELIYLGHCYQQGREPRDLDLEIWNQSQKIAA